MNKAYSAPMNHNGKSQAMSRTLSRQSSQRSVGSSLSGGNAAKYSINSSMGLNRSSVTSRGSKMIAALQKPSSESVPIKCSASDAASTSSRSEMASSFRLNNLKTSNIGMTARPKVRSWASVKDLVSGKTDSKPIESFNEKKEYVSALSDNTLTSHEAKSLLLEQDCTVAASDPSMDDAATFVDDDFKSCRSSSPIPYFPAGNDMNENFPTYPHEFCNTISSLTTASQNKSKDRNFEDRGFAWYVSPTDERESTLKTYQPNMLDIDRRLACDENQIKTKIALETSPDSEILDESSRTIASDFDSPDKASQTAENVESSTASKISQDSKSTSTSVGMRLFEMVMKSSYQRIGSIFSPTAKETKAKSCDTVGSSSSSNNIGIHETMIHNQSPIEADATPFKLLCEDKIGSDDDQQIYTHRIIEDDRAPVEVITHEEKALISVGSTAIPVSEKSEIIDRAAGNIHRDKWFNAMTEPSNLPKKLIVTLELCLRYRNINPYECVERLIDDLAETMQSSKSTKDNKKRLQTVKKLFKSLSKSCNSKSLIVDEAQNLDIIAAVIIIVGLAHRVSERYVDSAEICEMNEYCKRIVTESMDKLGMILMTQRPSFAKEDVDWLDMGSSSSTIRPPRIPISLSNVINAVIGHYSYSVKPLITAYLDPEDDTVGITDPSLTVTIEDCKQEPSSNTSIIAETSKAITTGQENSSQIKIVQRNLENIVRSSTMSLTRKRPLPWRDMEYSLEQSSRELTDLSQKSNSVSSSADITNIKSGNTKDEQSSSSKSLTRKNSIFLKRTDLTYGHRIAMGSMKQVKCRPLPLHERDPNAVFVDRNSVNVPSNKTKRRRVTPETISNIVSSQQHSNLLDFEIRREVSRTSSSSEVSSPLDSRCLDRMRSMQGSDVPASNQMSSNKPPQGSSNMSMQGSSRRYSMSPPPLPRVIHDTPLAKQHSYADISLPRMSSLISSPLIARKSFDMEC